MAKNYYLPIFPIFRKLTLEDEKHIDQLLESLPPYSDFVFSSLWCWNTTPEIEISSLNGNLVLKIPDYLSNETTITFLGSKSVEATIDALLKYCQAQGLKEVLRLLPEYNFQDYDLSKLESRYDLVEDRDNFDYILSVEKLSTMHGLSSKKNKVNIFQRKYPYQVAIENLNQKPVQKKIFTFVKNWFKNNKKLQSRNENELLAIRKLLRHSRKLNPKVLCVYIDKALIGFSIFELFNKEYAIHTFQKARREYKGIYEFLYHQMAKYLEEQNCPYINIEQDLGIEGLRQAKLGYKPTFLKKYIVSHKKRQS